VATFDIAVDSVVCMMTEFLGIEIFTHCLEYRCFRAEENDEAPNEFRVPRQQIVGVENVGMDNGPKAKEIG